jgi:hypothetical protein
VGFASRLNAAGLRVKCFTEGGLALVFSPSKYVDIDVIGGAGGTGLTSVLGSWGPAASAGITIYALRGRFSLGPSARLTGIGTVSNTKDGTNTNGYFLSPTIAVTGTYR